MRASYYQKGAVAMHRGWMVRTLLVAATLLPLTGRPVLAETGQVQFAAPPRGWNALTATAEELNRYNIPPKPGDPAQLAKWTDLVTRMRWERPTFDTGRIGTRPGLAGAPTDGGPSTLPTLNWGGLLTLETSTAVSGQWRQPYAYAESGTRPALATQWIGLGGFQTGVPLIQMGTEARVNPDGSGSYDAWYEIVGTSRDTAGARKVSFDHSQGDEIYSQIWWTEANGVGTAHFYIADLTRATATSFSVPTITNYAGVTSSAEWINELPTLKYGSAYLTLPYYSAADAGYVSFTEAQAGPAGQIHYVDPNAASTTYITTHREDTLLQGVSTLGAKGDFQTIWYNY